MRALKNCRQESKGVIGKMKALVGVTGFVGSNLFSEGKFDAAFHSQNIRDAYGLKPDLLVYAGLRAEKYLANQFPDKDWGLILQAQENIRKIAPAKLVLISTIDVFQNPSGAYEDTAINDDGLQAYGRHRYLLECWARQNSPNALIVRLPGLFGRNIKKNFLYDMIHIIPSMLKPEKYQELVQQDPRLGGFYSLQANGFYQCRTLTEKEQKALRGIMKHLGFTALNFTDHRSQFQFYPLKRLWKDIQTALETNIPLVHLATKPVSAGEVYQYVTGGSFVNQLDGKPAQYDFRTRHARNFGGHGEYLLEREEALEEIRKFVREETGGEDRWL